MDWPPYWEEATCAIDLRCAMLQAVEKLWGRSIRVPEMHGAVLQHVLEVHEVAVVHMLREVVGVVEVDDALVVRLDHLGGQQHAAP